MKFFNREELYKVGAILAVLLVVFLFNIRVSLRRARDAQRTADIGSISASLERYSADFGFYPPSANGKILACKGPSFDAYLQQAELESKFNSDKFFAALSPCEWGVDKLADLGNSSTIYLASIPKDPKYSQGYSYLYFSNTKRYQIYAYLEGGNSEDAYNQGVVERNLPCGSNICNFGKASSKVPLDKSIEEYENEISNN